MERNDVSFSIPTWRQEEIKSIGLAEQQALYMASPYNLNDFKNGQQSVQYIFAPNQQPSEIKSYVTKRELNPKVSKQIALFTTFLYEIILNDNKFTSAERLPSTQKNLQEIKNEIRLLGLLKQKIMQLNLCKLKTIPKEFQAYYQNDIIKKIIFQYLSKCNYNISLIEILLISNDFLRFTLEVCVKTILFQSGILSKFTDIVEFKEEVKIFSECFGYLFLLKKAEEASMNYSSTKNIQVFEAQTDSLRTEHYLLKLVDHKFFLYRKYIKGKYPYQIKLAQKPNAQTLKSKQKSTPKFKSGDNIKEKIRQLKAETKRESKKRDEREGFFCCLPCFRN